MTGRLGCVRSSAWHWLFSSQHNTSARSGGFSYSPITSQNFFSKFLSFEILNVRVTCGFTALALQSRCTVAFDTSIALAIVRTDHRVRFFGGRVALTMIFSRTCGAIRGLRPRPFASLKPSMPDFRKRCSQCTTTDWRTLTFRAVSVWLNPSARLRIIQALRLSRWEQTDD